MKAESTVVWRRLDHPGHEFARLFRHGSSWRLEGSAILVHEQLPCHLDYEIVCDTDWRSVKAQVRGVVGERSVDCTVEAIRGTWRLNGDTVSEVQGCDDVDLNFSPSTNLLPIRRLALAIGQSAPVRAAWLRFPSFTLEPLEQTYSRLTELIYRYESAGGRFVAEIAVNEAGLPVRYADLWVAEAMI